MSITNWQKNPRFKHSLITGPFTPGWSPFPVSDCKCFRRAVPLMAVADVPSGSHSNQHSTFKRLTGTSPSCRRRRRSISVYFSVQYKSSRKPVRGGGVSWPHPLKFGRLGQYSNCIWRLCPTGIKVMSITFPLTISKISRDCVNINVTYHVT